MLHLFEDVRGHEHLLCGNASSQGASPAEPAVFFYNGCLKTELTGSDGSDIAAGSAADNGYVELFVGQDKNPLRARGQDEISRELIAYRSFMLVELFESGHYSW